MKPTISVITCTHNPKRDYLERVLASLKSQTLAFGQWEYLLIDNAGDGLLSSEIDLSWHSQARHIREEQLGLTPARLRGIREAEGEILVFVDDDNVLEPNFLANTWEIGRDWSRLGAWGGQIEPEFEKNPPDWSKPYWNLLAIRQFDRDKWSNLIHQNNATPCGAGLCVRKVVAQKYSELVSNDSRRVGLDRKGDLMTSCGDSDLALTACDLGMGNGMFQSLKVTHLITAHRLEEEYLLKLVKGISYSSTILRAIRGIFPIKPCLSQQIFQQYTRWRMNCKERRFYDAKRAGENLAIQEIASW